MRGTSSVVGTCLLAFVAFTVLGCEESITQLEDAPTASASHKSLDGAEARSVNGGGHIRDGDWDVSFAGEITDLQGTPSGDWGVQFHNVSNDAISGGKFEATGVEDVTLFDGDSDSCDAAMNMTLSGTFNGESGWSIIFRVGDAGHTTDNDLDDTARVELYDPNGSEVYDTSDGDFEDTSDCVGTQRTNLDSGNLKMKV